MTTKLKKPLIKDYCKPFIFDPENKDVVSFNSRGYAKAAAKYIEQLEAEKRELIVALKGGSSYCLEMEDSAWNNVIDEIEKWESDLNDNRLRTELIKALNNNYGQLIKLVNREYNNMINAFPKI